MTQSTGNSKRSNSFHFASAKATADKLRRVRTAKIRMAPVTSIVAESSRWATGRDVLLAFVMAIGLSTVFLSPFRLTGSLPTAAVPESGERVLGASISVPLTVTVNVRYVGQNWRTSITPATGTLAEVLARTAGSVGSTFVYRSRGSSIYMTRFLDMSDDVSGFWTVRINGVAVTDLSLPVLEQGDEITVERQSV